MPRPTRLAPALGTALVLTVVLGGCNAARDQFFGAAQDENGVPINKLVKDAVVEALPDAVEVTPRTLLDGFANRLALTVTWPDEQVLDEAAVAAGVQAICEHVAGYDYVDFGFVRAGAGGRIDLTGLWPGTLPDVGRVDGSELTFDEDDCAVILG